MTTSIRSAIRRATLAAKVESAYGVDEFGGAPLAADILPVEDLAPSEPRSFYRNLAQSGLLDALPGIAGEMAGGMSCAIKLRGKGSAYAAANKPEAGFLMRALGANEAVDATVGAEKVTYTWPKAPDHASLSLVFMPENAPSLKVLGARGDGSFLLQAGQPVTLQCTLSGLHGGRGAQALVTSMPAATPIHPILVSAQFKIGMENFAAQFRSLSIALNNIVSPIMSPNDSRAYAGFFIARDPSRPITMQFDPEAVAAATFDWFSKWDSGTVMDWSFGTNGAQYTRLKFSGKAQISSLAWGTRDELRTHPITLELMPTAGEDSLTVVFD